MIIGPSIQTLTDAGNAAMLAQASVSSATVGELHNATCDLIVAPITPTGSTQFGDLTLPAWVGYAAQVVTWNPPTVPTVGRAEMNGTAVNFTLPSGAIGQQIYGWAISDTSPRLCAVAVLLNPQLVTVTDIAIVVPAIVITPDTDGSPIN